MTLRQIPPSLKAHETSLDLDPIRDISWIRNICVEDVGMLAVGFGMGTSGDAAYAKVSMV